MWAELTINAYHELGEMLAEVDKNRGGQYSRWKNCLARTISGPHKSWPNTPNS
jgi:hypothetical protein